MGRYELRCWKRSIGKNAVSMRNLEGLPRSIGFWVSFSIKDSNSCMASFRSNFRKGFSCEIAGLTFQINILIIELADMVDRGPN